MGAEENSVFAQRPGSEVGSIVERRADALAKGCIGAAALRAHGSSSERLYVESLIEERSALVWAAAKIADELKRVRGT